MIRFALPYLLLSRINQRCGGLDKATVAGYYGSDSAGTFATCVAVLAGVGLAFDAYMPVMLAVMEIPGCPWLRWQHLVARLRRRGMDARGNMPDEPGYIAPVPAMVPVPARQRPARLAGQQLAIEPDTESGCSTR